MPKPTFSQHYQNELRPILNNRVALHTRYGGILTVRDAWDWSRSSADTGTGGRLGFFSPGR